MDRRGDLRDNSVEILFHSFLHALVSSSCKGRDVHSLMLRRKNSSRTWLRKPGSFFFQSQQAGSMFHSRRGGWILFSLVIAEAILMRTSAEQVPSLHRVSPRYLKLVTSSNFWPFMLMDYLHWLSSLIHVSCLTNSNKIEEMRILQSQINSVENPSSISHACRLGSRRRVNAL